MGEIGEKEEQPRQPFFGRKEELVDEIRLDLDVVQDQKVHEPFREVRLLMEHADHCLLFNPDDARCHQRDGGGQANPLASETPFAEEIARAEQGDDGFLALIGNNRELNPPPLDVEDGLGGVALPEDDPPRPHLELGLRAIGGGENGLDVEGRRLLGFFAPARFG